MIPIQQISADPGKRLSPETAFLDRIATFAGTAGPEILAAPAFGETAAADRRRAEAEGRNARFIPERFRHSSLATYRPANPSQTAALAAVRNWLRAAAVRRGPMLLLVGPKGVGKSHLLYGAVAELNLSGRIAAAANWLEFSDVLRESKRATHDCPPDLRQDVFAAIRTVKALRTAPNLALDELRSSSGTEFDPQELSRLIISAYDRRAALIATTQMVGRHLDELVGLAGVDRLTIQVMDGDSYRKSKPPPPEPG